MTRPRTATAAAVALVASIVLAGCAGMPSDGPIVAAQVPAATDRIEASDIDPVPPTPGETPAEIAQGFLDAMTASPIRLDVARAYLSPAASAWSPQDATITYRDTSIRLSRGGGVTVELIGANRLDHTGAWQGPVSSAASRLRLRFSLDADGQYRIDDPPNALVVPETWFAQRFQAASLYFFDPTGRTLAPQPVFVPRGDQFATTLVSDLLEGPPPSLRGVVRSFVPTPGKVRLSVPVTDGVADIAISSSEARVPTQNLDRLLAQLATTLRQDTAITGIRLSIDGADVALPGGQDQYTTDEAARFDATGYLSSTRLYGLADGELRAAYGADFGPTSGPLGERRHRLRSVAVSLGGNQVAAVLQRGDEVILAPTGPQPSANEPDGTGSDTGVVPSTATSRVVLRGGVDLLRPAWDVEDRLWLVDRDAGSAVVTVVERGRARVVDVPGVTGRDVRGFLVSRDGTRFVAAVRGARTDTLLVGRVRVDPAGRVQGVGLVRRVAGSVYDPLRVQALAWASPTTMAVLSPAQPGQLAEVRSYSVDGSPAGLDSISTSVGGTVVGLAGSPTPGKPLYAVTTQGLTDLDSGVATPFGGGPVRSVGYVG